MTWRAYFIHTMTGDVGPEVEMSTDGRWDVMLNDFERTTVTVQKSSLLRIEPKWFDAWSGGILLTFTPEWDYGEGLEVGEETPIVAGPISGPPSEYTDSLSFTMLGIRAVLEHRLLLREDFLAGGSSVPTGAQLSALLNSKITYTGADMAYIAQDMVRRGLNKQNGALPIEYAKAASSAAVAGGLTITYNGYDLANANIHKRLLELSSRIGGPDVMFRPEWVDDTHQAIRWVMHTGNVVSPVIEQSWVMSVDTTAPRNSISEQTLNSDGEHYATRVYATGAGEGPGIALAARDGEGLYRQEHPLLETAITIPDVTEAQTLFDYATAAVDIRPKIELHLTVDGNDPATELGRWHVGDNVEVTVAGWMLIPDGTHELRLIRAAGDLDSGFTTLYFQEDQW